VLQVPQHTSGHWYQKYATHHPPRDPSLTGPCRALLSTEVEEIFNNAPAAPNSVTNPRVKEALDRALGRKPANDNEEEDAGAESSQGNKRIPTEDDDCPICYEKMDGNKLSSLSFCEQCGNALHKECFEQCQFYKLYLYLLPFTHASGLIDTDRANAQRSGRSLTCVFCRAPWQTAAPTSSTPTKGGATISRDGYLNLGSVAGVSPVRDTSTCKFIALYIGSV
jgi:hypothetical protein